MDSSQISKTEAQRTLLEKLREMFELESSDLDFGIYRIMNNRRKEIEDFIKLKLIEEIKSQIGLLSDAESLKIKSDIAQIQSEISEAFGEDALQGDLLKNPFQETPLGKRYIAKLKELNKVQVDEDTERTIYNYILAFFSRYYQEGDFIGKRRYGRTDRYIIPYHGEEIILQWATQNQYYVKTNEWFKNYSFKASGLKVNFKIHPVEDEDYAGDAGAKRYFIIHAEDPFKFSKNTNNLDIYFEYRSLNVKEIEKFGTRAKQTDLNKETTEFLKQRLVDNNLRDLFENAVNSSFEKNLLKYTKRNTVDYFIHKDLEQFLETELNFYLINEVLRLDNPETIDRDRIERYILIANVIKNISGKIIDFLGEIENFQKKLWEKKKFVTKTDYVISLKTLKQILQGEEYDEIERLFKEKISEDNKFKEDLISAIKETYKQPGSNIYVREVRFEDDSVRILYKKKFTEKDKFDNYASKQGSIWYVVEKALVRDKYEDCWFAEYSSEKLVDKLSYSDLYIDTAFFDEDIKFILLEAISKNTNLDEVTNGLLIRSENFQALNLLRAILRDKVKLIYIDPPYNTGNDDFLYKDNYFHASWMSMMENRLSMSKDLLHDSGSLYASIDWNESHTLKKLLDHIFTQDNFQREIIWNTGDNISGHKSIAPNWIRQHDTIYFYSKDSKKVEFNKLWKPIDNPDDESNSGNISWYDIVGHDKEHLFTEKWVNGKLTREDFKDTRVKALGDTWNDILSFQFSELRVTESWFFKTQKVEGLLRRIIQFATNPGELVLDFFLGSGTTASAAHKLGRKWVGIELGDQFEVELIRMKTVLLGENRTHLSREVEWQGGGIFKYISLEQYEDALENIEFGQKKLPEFEDYFIKYMLDFETRNSKTFLDINQFEDPFNYKLRIADAYEFRYVSVDFVETFNLLIGLKVQKLWKNESDGRRYVFVFGNTGKSTTLVIWRSTKNLEFDKDKKLIDDVVAQFDPELLYINGDAGVENFKQIESEIKFRLW